MTHTYTLVLLSEAVSINQLTFLCSSKPIKPNKTYPPNPRTTMAFRALRPLSHPAAAAAAAIPRAPTAAAAAASTSSIRRQFLHATPRAFVKVGDAIPDLEVLVEDSPGNKLSLAKELASTPKAVIVGVPAAFSGACSTTHVPGYINHPKLREAGKVFVVSVNDPFV